tara:strand:+ start:5332 stop:5841 length:510 start_codon:yes stop_codon:yes gene_type:complete
MVLPIVSAMQSLQGLLTSISGGLSSMTSVINGMGTAFTTVAESALSELGGAFDTLEEMWNGIFNKEKVEEAIKPVSQFTTAQEVSDAGYADTIIRGKIQQEQIAAGTSRKQQASDYAEIMRNAGSVNVSINASGITDQTDKRKMARDLAAQVQSEMARFNAGQTHRPRL